MHETIFTIFVIYFFGFKKGTSTALRNLVACMILRLILQMKILMPNYVKPSLKKRCFGFDKLPNPILIG